MNKKNVFITIISVLILTCLFAFARTTTTDLELVKPTWDENVDILDDINANSDILEAFANDVLEFDLSPVLRANLDIATFNIEGVDATEFGYLDGISAYGGTIIDDADAAAARTTLGLIIGTNVQAYDAGLLSIAALTTAANKSIYTTALDTYSVYDLTAFGRSILDDANEATFKATVNLEIGTDVLAYQAVGIADNNLLEVDGTPNSTEYARFTANGLEGRTEAEFKGDFNLEIGTDIQAFDNALTSISALAYVSPSFIKLTNTNTYAVRTLAEVKTDLAYQLSDLSDVGVTTPTDKYILAADGDSWESRAISSADLSDVASIAMLDEEETVTGCWIFSDYFHIYRTSDAIGGAPYLCFTRKRTTGGDVESGDELGNFCFNGWYTDSYVGGAEIRAIVDGTPGAGDMPGRLEFLTTPDGDYAGDLRMEIDNAGNIKMGDGAWTNYINTTAAGVMTAEGTATITATDLVITSQAAGDILYFNGTNWIRLAKGTTGQVLTMNAGGTAPEWQTP